MITLMHHIQNACDSLKSNRTRTFLTVSGVGIGIASIVAILSLATGATHVVTKQVDEIGGNIAVIRSGYEPSLSPVNLINQQTHNPGATSTLTESDLSRIKALPSVTAASPLLLGHSTLTGEVASQAVLVGTTPSFFSMSHIAMKEGTFEETSQPLITIGVQLSIDLFGTEDSLGKTVTIKGQVFRIGGIIDKQQNPTNFNGIDINKAAFLSPLQLRGINPAVQIQQINIQVASVTDLENTVIAINKELLSQHGGDHDFRVLTGDEIAAPAQQFFSVIAGVTATIAGISLFVGGIGIMNIMLVNVAERTREIGIRKALGASRGDILWQFLIESIIMALLGGISGVVIGFGFAFGVSLFLTFDPYITWHTIAIAMGVAGSVGVLFGLYPALRAAHKNPIEALNQHT
jgi:ABC-type antimicrobial peptide transport system permease subunit